MTEPSSNGSTNWFEYNRKLKYLHCILVWYFTKISSLKYRFVTPKQKNKQTLSKQTSFVMLSGIMVSLYREGKMTIKYLFWKGTKLCFVQSQDSFTSETNLFQKIRHQLTCSVCPGSIPVPPPINRGALHTNEQIMISLLLGLSILKSQTPTNQSNKTVNNKIRKAQHLVKCQNIHVTKQDWSSFHGVLFCFAVGRMEHDYNPFKWESNKKQH